MTNHEGIYAFLLPKGFDAMLRAPFNRAIISTLLFFFDNRCAIIAIAKSL